MSNVINFYSIGSYIQMKKYWNRIPRVAQAFIDGEYTPSNSKKKIKKLNPSTGTLLYEWEPSGYLEFDKAVRSAKIAQKIWSSSPVSVRSKILSNISHILHERNDSLSRLEALDTGKSISECNISDIVSAQTSFDWFSKICHILHGTSMEIAGGWGYTKFEPIGVCGGIGSWNYPIQGMTWKVGPATGASNALIFKPAPDTSLTALRLAEIYVEAGAPSGLVNILLGGSKQGEWLCKHSDVGKISFTGSRTVGKKIMALSSETLKRVTLELGGKSPLIIFSDCNMENAISAVMMGNWFSNGEVCSNCTRVFVQRNCLRKFLTRLIKRTKLITIGDPQHPDTMLGPMINKSQYDKVKNYINKGKQNNATCILDGTIVDGMSEEFKKGYFIGPTIFSDCTDDMTICRDEIFGPILTILPFDYEEEVIARANDTYYGLAAGIFTSNIQRAHRIIHKLHAGVCYINTFNTAPVEMPWGGFKQSGIGRENGLDVLKYWSEEKSIHVEMSDGFSFFL